MQVDGDPLGYFRVLIVADYEALQSIRDSVSLSPVQLCIIKGPVMQDMGDILGEDVVAKERASASLSRRSTLNAVPPNGLFLFFNEEHNLVCIYIQIPLNKLYAFICLERRMSGGRKSGGRASGGKHPP